MGVMPCTREGCENILCSRIVDGHGYICEECYEELVALKETWPEKMFGSEVRQRIAEFMRSEPRALLEVDTNEEFSKIVGD